MSDDKPVDADLKCSRCGIEGSGRVTDKFLEAIGWRKINGAWVCFLCAGTGYGGLYRVEGGE